MPDYSVQLLERLGSISGFVGAALADSDSGMTLGTVGGRPDFNMELAAALTTEVVRTKHRAMLELDLDDLIEDIIVTLNGQYHLICPLKMWPQIFLYLVLERSTSNLAMARMELSEFEGYLEI